METLDIKLGQPSQRDLSLLESRCRSAIESLRSPDSEVKLPVFIEFAGSPKSGKSSIIGIVAHFLKRQGLKVVQPVEGASLRTPERFKDDWLAFNAWSACYALQNILEDSFDDPVAEIVLLDRGLFDVAGWMEFLQSEQRRITLEDKSRIIEFFTLDFWRRRINGVFLFAADHDTSIARETNSKLCTAPGSVMNRTTLTALLDAYKRVAAEIASDFDSLFLVDTSFRNGYKLDFQMVAFQVAEKIVEVFENLGTQELLVTDRVGVEGFELDESAVAETREAILRDGAPTFVNRREAEESATLKQVVPYALLKNKGGKYFRARRRADLRRKELRKKLTILVGGHAERKDWDASAPGQVFENCLKRELDEELVGIRIESITPVGFVFDPHTSVGNLHLAYIHEVTIGGTAAVRRQAVDKEFGREAIEWITADEICECVDELDPWSQLVAARLFGAELPPNEGLFPRRA